MQTAPLMFLVAVLAMSAWSCDTDSTIRPTLLTNFGTQVNDPGTQVVTVGQPFAGTIFTSDAPCTFGDVFGPCRRFRVTAPRTGFLRIGLHGFGGTNRLEIVRLDRSSCCVSSLFTTCQVRSGSIFDFAIVMRAAANILERIPHAFELTTSIDTVAVPAFSCR